MPYDPFNARNSKIIEERLSDWHLPGASFAVIYGDDTWTKGFGHAQLNPSIPAEPETLWYACSTTKAVLCAAWAIYIASDENRARGAHAITWSTPLADIIRDDFVLVDEAVTGQVTLEDAVSHRSGMPAHDQCYGQPGMRTVRDITRAFRHLPLQTPLRSHWEYCNIMYIAASHALEVVTGQSTTAVMREWLWKPLGMTQTYGGRADAAKAIEKGAVLGKCYNWNRLPWESNDGGEYIEAPQPDLTEAAGAGFIISDAHDFAKWMRCLVNGATPLSDALTEELFAPRAIAGFFGGSRDPLEKCLDGGFQLYSLGWFMGSYRGYKVIFAPGGMLGGGSMVMIVPQLKWGATFFANGTGPSGNMVAVLLELLDDALEVPTHERKLERFVKDFAESKAALEKEMKEARHKLYPGAPEKPSVPLSLPLEQYAGVYVNDAYGSITLTAEKDRGGLKCYVADRTWPMSWTFDQVNAEFWILNGGHHYTPWKHAKRGQSRIGVDGNVEEFGIAMEEAMPDNLIWFSKKS